MTRVMIVDDAAFMRLSIKQMLERGGFEVVAEASDGEEAVRKYMVHHPDIVTMDITMPVMTGIEAVRMIRAEDDKAKIVMVSAMGQESMVRDAIMSGAKSFIVKPFKEEQVIETIQKIANM